MSNNDTSVTLNTRYTTFRASNLLPFSTYSVMVSARTIVGLGMEVATAAMTKESCKCL